MRTNHKDPSPETQKGQILDYLYGTFRTLNAMQALKKFGTMKLSTRIGEIERDYKLTVKRERNKNTGYMEYSIIKPMRS